MPTSSRRTLLQALTISLLVHGALLLSVASLYPLRLDVPATTINAVINRSISVDQVNPVSSPATKLLAKSVKPSSAVVRRDPKPKRVVPTTFPVTSFSEPPAQHAQRDSATPSSVSGDATKAGPLSTPAPTRAGVSADDMRQYRLSLAMAARRFKSYPALARERGWEGTVEVALNISSLMLLPEVYLVKSSGRGILDDQALQMIAQSARLTSLPEGLRGQDFRVLLPVKFSLEDDQ